MNRTFKIVFWGIGAYFLSINIVMLVCALFCAFASLSSEVCDTLTIIGGIIAMLAVLISIVLKLKDIKNPNAGRNNIAAALLAILLGCIGAHKYYCRKYMWGIIYTIFFWSGLPSAIGIVEGITYILMDNERFNNSLKGTSF